MKLYLLQGAACVYNFGAGAAVIAERFEDVEPMLNAWKRARGDSWYFHVHETEEAAQDREDAQDVRFSAAFVGMGNEEPHLCGHLRLVLVEAFDVPHERPRVVMFQENFA